jgi:hypothetical protein
MQALNQVRLAEFLATIIQSFGYTICVQREQISG